jgi:tetratricopeptide (TPR) repeat protein
MMHLERREYLEALERFRAATLDEPDDWYVWYGAGQSARLLERLDEGRDYLEVALRLNPGSTIALHAYGIVLQLTGELARAKATFAQAIEIDPDLAESFNSLALTQRLGGELEKAVANYEAGCHALARRIVKRLTNDRADPVYPVARMYGEVWFQTAMFGALWLWANEENAGAIAFPTDETAREEEKTHRNGGLYYIEDSKRRKKNRAYLPNFFNGFQVWLFSEPIFAQLVGNQGSAYSMLGQQDVAEARFAEAQAFSRQL